MKDILGEGRKNEITRYTKDEYTLHVGPSGTMILFDTNCPHFAGQVQEGNFRRVFRFDYEKKEWMRKPNLLEKLKLLLRSVKSKVS